MPQVSNIRYDKSARRGDTLEIRRKPVENETFSSAEDASLHEAQIVGPDPMGREIHLQTLNTSDDGPSAFRIPNDGNYGVVLSRYDDSCAEVVLILAAPDAPPGTEG